jgi:hypothetical protein
VRRPRGLPYMLTSSGALWSSCNMRWRGRPARVHVS